VFHGEQQVKKPAKRFELAKNWYQEQQSEIQQESLYDDPVVVVHSYKKPSQYQYEQGPTLQNVIEPPRQQPPQRPADSGSLAAQINAHCVQETGQFPFPQDCRKFVNCWKVKI